MDSATVLNAFIAVVLFMAGALMTFGMVVLKGIQGDIVTLRKRLHIVEGQYGSVIAHIEFMNKALDTLRDVHVRLAKVEAKR